MHHVANTIKLFATIFISISQSAIVFVTASHFNPSLIFAGKSG